MQRKLARELARGNLALEGGGAACARRRAALSVAMMAPDPAAAKHAVDAVFDRRVRGAARAEVSGRRGR